MGENVYLWSTTAATNASADSSINWSENQLPGTVNNSARGMMAAIAKFIKDNNGTLTSTGSANAYLLTANTAYAALATGLTVWFRANFSNTGAATLTLTPSGGAAFAAKSIMVSTAGGGLAVAAGQIAINSIVLAVYDATANGAAGAWILINPAFAPGLPTLYTFGAKGDGVTNDSAALTAADTAGAHLLVTPGTYLIDEMVLTGLKGMTGMGRPTFSPSSNVHSGATQAFQILFSGSGCDNAVVSGIKASASKATYPNLYLLCASGVSGMRLTDNVTAGGGIGIYAANCINHTIERNSVSGYATKGISCDGASQNTVNIIENYINGSGSNNHCISASLGNRVNVIGNYAVSGGYSGAYFLTVGFPKFHNNQFYNSVHEGIALEDCSTSTIVGNTCYWDAAVSTDIGVTVFGNAAANQYSVVTNNLVVNSNSAGICLTTNVSFCRVADNTVLNCSRSGLDPGILLTGSNCLKNTVEDNTIVDTVGTLHTYGVAEINRGVGLPSLNTIRNNTVDGWVTSAVLHINTIAPTSLAANTDNYAPTSGRYYEHWNISSTGAVNLTGIADGYAGARKVLRNAGAFTITLKENVTSTAGNRFFFGADFALTASTSVVIEWQSGVNGWVRA